uniref:Solute carrier family 23 member 1 n=1 Tax=Sipha flava TaxID=143950 RepID=A0A2S2QYL4_9HEMI
MWIACVYMTSNNNLLPTDPANTDSKSGVFHNSQIFRLPYPFQWGWPKFSLTSIMAMLPALFISIVESVGNFYTCAKIANLKTPPANVVNRGIGVQGISSILAGFLGIGSGVGVSSENVGNIGITQVCSRNVIVYAACLMILISPFTKLIALLVTLPDPVLGAVTSILLVLITAVALSNLQFINLNSIRNMYILGMSMFFGLTLPKYFLSVSVNNSLINTKYEMMNNIISVYLSSGMLIGGLIGFVLDNTIPDDEDQKLNGDAYQAADNKVKKSIDNENDQIYSISDRLYEKINYLLTFFV